MNNYVHFFEQICIFLYFIKTKARNIHRGEVLEAAVKESSINITQMCKRMGISRGTYYNHRSEPELPFEILEQYGRVLKHDFTQDFPAMRKYSLEDPEHVYNAPKNLDEAFEQIAFWKDKYYQLMEAYHKMVMERNP